MTTSPFVPVSLSNSSVSLQHMHRWSQADELVDFSDQIRPESALNIAGIVSDRLFKGLTPYCNFHVVTPDNWHALVEVIQPELLIVESFMISCDYKWHLSQTRPSLDQDELIAIIKNFEKAGIPCVYWDTNDISYIDQYQSFSQNFEFKFYSDPRYCLRNASGVSSKQILKPACVPSIHNPIQAKYTEQTEINPRILFNGWADLIRNDKALSFLRELTKDEIKIVDSRFSIFKTQITGLSGEIKDAILGSVDYNDLIYLLKKAEFFLSSNHTISSQLSQQWAAVEAAACRCVMLHHGDLSSSDFRSGFMHSYNDADQLIYALRNTFNDKISADIAAQKSWRHVHSHHTFAHRLQRIADVIGLNYTWDINPSVSVITATFRVDLIENIIGQYDNQTWHNKELILALNGNNIEESSYVNYIKGRKDIKVTTVPAERVEAGSLNHAISLASGKYVVKMDDDDIYGTHYVSDYMLHTNAANLDLFGKVNRYFYFDDAKKSYQRTHKKSLTTIPSDKLLDAHISGATASGKTEFFRKNPYPEGNFSATDTHFYGNIQGKVQGNFAVTDNLSFLCYRRPAEFHSWKMDSEKLRASMTYLDDGIFDKILA